MVSTFYDGTKLLSLKDIDGDTPEIYICTTNRSGGKTTYFNRMVTNRFLEGKGKFAVLYRFSYELQDCADKFFKDIGGLFFPNYLMRSESRARGAYYELFIYKRDETDVKNPGVSCGYALALNNADQYKKLSHLLSDTMRIVFDEFQSETNHYCSNEVDKLYSIHKSIARGQGKQSRYVPVYMIANPVSLLNPYYVEFDLSTRLQKDTKFLRGSGFVLEQGYVESASNAIKNSTFSKAFKHSNQVAYAAQAIYLNDNAAFVQKMTGRSVYVATFRYMGCDYAIRMYPEQGVVYCDDKADTSFPTKLSITTEDHNINYVMLRANADFITNIRYYFDRGCFRFKNIKCKEAVLKALSY